MLRAIASLIAAATVAAAPVAHAHPDDLDNRPASSLSPGVGIGTYGADARPTGSCTAGWLVRDAHGDPGLLTAGHCSHGGGAVYNNTSDGYVPVGRFIRTVHEGSGGTDADIAWLGITFPVDTDTHLATDPPAPVTAPVDAHTLADGTLLCKVGLATGTRCGPLIGVTDSKLRFAAKHAEGDSGGPVYRPNRDGSVSPVGITLGGSHQDSSSVAELIRPWLRRWDLTIDTTPLEVGVSPVDHQHS